MYLQGVGSGRLFSCFSYNLEGKLYAHFLVESDGAVVFSRLLDVFFESDELAVNIVSELLKSLSDSGGVD